MSAICAEENSLYKKLQEALYSKDYEKAIRLAEAIKEAWRFLEEEK